MTHPATTPGQNPRRGIPRGWIACGLLTLSAATVLWISQNPAAPQTDSPDLPELIKVLPAAPEAEIPVTQLYKPHATLAEVERIIDLSDPLSLAERENQLAKIVNSLQPADLDSLFAFFAQPAVEVENWSPGAQHALKNNLLNVILLEDQTAWNLKQRLIQLSDASAADLVMRNYALQHLAILQSDRAGDATKDHQRHLLALDDPETSIAATAMLHLLAFHQQGDLNAEGLQKLRQAAWRLASDATTPASSRATALQAARRLELPGVSQLAFRLAEDHSQPFILRIAAIASLEQAAATDLEVKTFLQETAAGREFRLRKPARAALERSQNI